MFNEKNYFQLFGLSPSWQVDLKQLRKKYFELQSNYHPDRNNQEIEFSALLNKAYQTLLDPLLRGGYLINLQGFNLEDHNDQDLFMEVMMLQEELDELDYPQAQGFLDNLQAKSEAALNAFSEHYEQKQYDNAKTCYFQAKYYQQIIERTKKKFDL